MQAVIHADDDDLNGFDDPEQRPGWFTRLLAWLLRPLVPLANRAARLRYEIELAQHARDLEAEKRRRRTAEFDCDAAKQEKETLAKMHARIVAMLQKEIAVHNGGAKAAGER